jgi:hypothetical protein
MQPPYALPETQFEFEIIYKSLGVVKVELIDQVEPYEVMDKLNINKHGIIFKNLIYAPDVTQTSFHFYLRKGTYEIEERIRMKAEIYSTSFCNKTNAMEANELIAKWEFFNTLTVHQITLQGMLNLNQMQNMTSSRKDKKEVNPLKVEPIIQIKENTPFLFVCYLELSEAPKYLKLSKTPATTVTDIYWVVRVFSSDSLAFVKDTFKEDYERSIKDAWEINEPGRGDLAKRSRFRYMIECKKEKGEKLTFDEQIYLQDNRERKISHSVNIVEESKLKNGKLQALNSPKKLEKVEIGSKKTLNKPTSQVQLTSRQITESTPRIILKTLPKPEEHSSNFIKDFLFYTYQERTILFDNKVPQIESIQLFNIFRGYYHRRTERKKIKEYFSSV